MLVSAEDIDDRGNPNDPAVNDRANACFAGGDMEGKCDTEWEWMCGWHIIRLDDPQDEASRTAFPPACASLLPALNVIEPQTPVIITFHTAGCVKYQDDAAGVFSIDFGGGNYKPLGTQTYETANCTPPLGITSGVPVVYAPDGAAAARILCTTNGHTSLGDRLLNGVYKCW